MCVCVCMCVYIYIYMYTSAETNFSLISTRFPKIGFSILLLYTNIYSEIFCAIHSFQILVQFTNFSIPAAHPI